MIASALCTQDTHKNLKAHTFANCIQVIRRHFFVFRVLSCWLESYFIGGKKFPLWAENRESAFYTSSSVFFACILFRFVVIVIIFLCCFFVFLLSLHSSVHLLIFRDSLFELWKVFQVFVQPVTAVNRIRCCVCTYMKIKLFKRRIYIVNDPSQLFCVNFEQKQSSRQIKWLQTNYVWKSIWTLLIEWNRAEAKQ